MESYIMSSAGKPLLGMNLKVGLILGVLSYIFMWTTHNPLGIKGYAEVVSIACFVFSTIYVFRLQRVEGGVEKILFFVYVVPIILVFLSSLISYVKYSQPFFYGVIENRRVFIVYGFFVLIYLYRELGMELERIVNIFIAFGLLSLVLGVLLQFGLIPKLNNNEVADLIARKSRAAVGESVVVMAFFASISLYFLRRNVRYIYCSVILLIFIGLVIQSRQVLIGVVISSLLIFWVFNLSASKIAWGSLSAIFATAVTYFFSSWWADVGIVSAMQDMLSSETLEDSVRARTISIILSDFEPLGHGALSLLWNDGFHYYYGENFFLADVGIFGVFFQYGIFAVFYAVIFLALVGITLIRTEKSEVGRVSINISRCLALYLIVGLPVAAPIEYRGALVSYMLFFYYTGTRGR